MRIEPVAARRRALSLTSLIDVIFLLLLFFMLSSTFTRFAEVTVSGGRASAAAPGHRPDILIQADGLAWRINGLDVGEEDLTRELSRLEVLGAASAVILLRGDMTSQTLVGVLERIAAGTDLAVTVAR